MKKQFTRSVAVGSFLLALSAHAVVGSLTGGKTKTKQNSAPEARSGEFIVKFRSSGISVMESAAAPLATLGLAIREAVNLSQGLVKVRLENAQRMGILPLAETERRDAIVQKIQSLPNVEFAEPNFIYRAMVMNDEAPSVTPNDARFGQLWGMKNVGQTDGQNVKGTPGADIKAEKAWAIGTGSEDIVVAVIDTGIDYTHHDLQGNIWSKPGEPNVHGYNAITQNNNSMDDNSHGTHCSGTIGGRGDNGVGVAGVNWHVKLMGVKFLTADGSGDLAGAIRAIDWAVDNNAQVLSNSWGGGGFSQALMDAIQRAADKGVVFVAASGNDASNNDSSPTYPAGYQVSNVIAVAASNNKDLLADFSNYGLKNVHLMAPGDGILSTVPGDDYKVYSGTSMATPHVAGASALLLSREPSLTPTQVRERLMSSSDKLKGVRRQLVSGGRLNIYNLLANIVPPGFVTIPDSAWSAPISNAIATAHPYGGNVKQRWEINQAGAKFIRVHFKKFATESKYDVLRLISGETGEVVEVMSGKRPDDFWSAEIPGQKMILEMQSDDSVDDYGFEIDSYGWTTYTGTN